MRVQSHRIRAQRRRSTSPHEPPGQVIASLQPRIGTLVVGRPQGIVDHDAGRSKPRYGRAPHTIAANPYATRPNRRYARSGCRERDTSSTCQPAGSVVPQAFVTSDHCPTAFRAPGSGWDPQHRRQLSGGEASAGLPVLGRRRRPHHAGAGNRPPLTAAPVLLASAPDTHRAACGFRSSGRIPYPASDEDQATQPTRQPLLEFALASAFHEVVGEGRRSCGRRLGTVGWLAGVVLGLLG